MKRIDLIKDEIKKLFPNMDEKQIQELAEKYIIDETLKRLPMMSEEQMRKEIEEGI